MDFDHFRITGYGLIPDSCGHGLHRGGLGFYRRFEILKDDVNFAMYADRFRIAPYGLFGGTEGSCGSGEILRNGKIIPLKSKDGLVLKKGDVITIFTAGGGGYGPINERKRGDIDYDVLHGFVSKDKAKATYE
jgi:N-methylhydantoinase B